MNAPTWHRPLDLGGTELPGFPALPTAGADGGGDGVAPVERAGDDEDWDAEEWSVATTAARRSDRRRDALRQIGAALGPLMAQPLEKRCTAQLSVVLDAGLDPDAAAALHGHAAGRHLDELRAASGA